MREYGAGTAEGGVARGCAQSWNRLRCTMRVSWLRQVVALCRIKHDPVIFLCLPRAERNQRFLFVKNESIKFCFSGGFSNVPDVMEASVLFISTVFHVRSVSCRCLYLGFRAPCAARVTRVTCSKRSLLGVPLELE